MQIFTNWCYDFTLMQLNNLLPVLSLVPAPMWFASAFSLSGFSTHRLILSGSLPRDPASTGRWRSLLPQKQVSMLRFESSRPRFHKVALHLGGYSLLSPISSHSCVFIQVCKGGICFLMTGKVLNPGPLYSMINRLCTEMVCGAHGRRN